MPLSLYLDDCADDDTLIALLRRSGHDVTTPRLAGTVGASDREHLDYAARNRQTLLTKDPADFLELHADWQVAHRPHSGILLVYEEKEVSKNMSRAQIVIAIDHLLASSLAIANEIHTLNHWR
jgi:predicted nuclease of predicted toxin-antitoxin system